MLRTLPLLSAFLAATAALAEPPRVVADIPPVHGLVSMVMAGTGAPGLLLEPGSSAHDFALRPSQARLLDEAGLVVWIGPELAPQLSEALDQLVDGPLLSLAEVAGTHRLAMRDMAVFEDHDHGHGHGHDDDHGHADGDIDPHLWLDPDNARLWLTAIAEALSEIDPEQAALYRSNAETAAARITLAEADARAMLAPVAERPLAVYHDAFQYYEAAFGLTTIGAVSDSDEVAPGPKRLADLRDHFARTRPVCILREPGGALQLLAAVGAQDVATAELDALGAKLPLGAGHYPALLTDLAQHIATCADPG